MLLQNCPESRVRSSAYHRAIEGYLAGSIANLGTTNRGLRKKNSCGSGSTAPP